MSQHYRQSILVICEGQRSEPDYFDKLRNEVINKNKDIYIKILPKPKNELQDIENDLKNFKLRKGGKKRKIKNLIGNEPKSYVLESLYKAQPVCYVRKAQLGFEEFAYTELWAVYDKDGHPNHREALDLSNNTSICKRKVNIAFSSIAFEEWILMHFNYSGIQFEKSQCRGTDKVPYYCGTSVNENDCKGSKCVVGNIIQNEYLKLIDGKNFKYEDFSSFYLKAFKNALKSRMNASNKHFFDNKPFVSVDRLVFKFKYLHKTNVIWLYKNCVEISKNVIITFIFDNELVSINLKNNSDRTYKLNNNMINLIDTNFKSYMSNSSCVFNVNEDKNIVSFNKNEVDSFSYVLFEVNSNDSYILDISQVLNFT